MRPWLRRPLPLGGLAAAVLVSIPAGAQRPDSTRRDSARTLQAVEVRGSAAGFGQARTVNAIAAPQLRVITSGTSALKAVETLPGVNYQGADPFGRYEWANRVTIRGFQTQQIGQTFDDLPLGDMSYGNFNGLGIGRAVDPDNLSDVGVAQGTGALGTASSNNLGGVVQYHSTEPDNRRTFTLKQMAGTPSARRTYGRFDTGLMPIGTQAAFKGFASLSRYDTDKWKGGGERYSPDFPSFLFGQSGFLGRSGEQWQDQLNAKAQLLFGRHKLTGYYNFSDRTELDYADLSLSRYHASGRLWDQFQNWSTAQAYATSSTQDEAYFKSALGARKDNLGYLSGEFQLTDRALLRVTGYGHTNIGNGDWHAPSYGADWSPDPIYFRETQYDIHRWGTLARARITLPGNDLELGAWLERNNVDIRRVGWRLEDYATGAKVDFDNVIRLFFDRTGEMSTRTLYAQNTNHFLEQRLSVTYGAKYLYVGADFTNNGQTIASAASAPDVGRPNASIPTDGGILPQAGLVFRTSPRDEFFANYSENVNAFPYSPQSGVYNTNPQAFEFFKAHTDPEKARTLELGVRTRRDRVEASLSVYGIDYRNRLVGVAVCPVTATCVSSFANVGNVSSKGVEGLLALTLAQGVTWTTSLALNDSQIEDDYETAPGEVVRSSGMTVVDAPKTLVNTQLRVRRGGITSSVNARSVGKRYFSILNDASVPAYTVVDAALGYEFGRIGALRGLSLQLNVANVFDEDYISTVGTNGFTLSGDTQTLMSGVRRLVFFTVGTTF